MLATAILNLLRKLKREVRHMAQELEALRAAVAAVKASADRANANTEKLLARPTGGVDPAEVQAQADALKSVSASLDAESDKVDASEAPPPTT
jgi:hypothetical protein